MSFKSFVTTSVAASAVAASLAVAPAAHAGSLYATEVYDLLGNPAADSPFDPHGDSDWNDRNNPANALGAPDGLFAELSIADLADGDTDGHGRYSDLVFGFGSEFSLPGKVFEITFGKRANWLEKANIYVGASDVFATDAWVSLATITNQTLDGISAFGEGVDGIFTYLRIEDATPPFPDPRDEFAGFDIDSVAVAAVPEPATVLGFMALGALGLASKVKRSAKA